MSDNGMICAFGCEGKSFREKIVELEAEIERLRAALLCYGGRAALLRYDGHEARRALERET